MNNKAIVIDVKIEKSASPAKYNYSQKRLMSHESINLSLEEIQQKLEKAEQFRKNELAKKLENIHSEEEKIIKALEKKQFNEYEHFLRLG